MNALFYSLTIHKRCVGCGACSLGIVWFFKGIAVIGLRITCLRLGRGADYLMLGLPYFRLCHRHVLWGFEGMGLSKKAASLAVLSGRNGLLEPYPVRADTLGSRCFYGNRV